MLILSRKTGESIIIGDRVVTITFLNINQNTARVGITAPRDIAVHRHEIYERIKAQEPNLANENEDVFMEE